jgi:hypothetical protein
LSFYMIAKCRQLLDLVNGRRRSEEEEEEE